MTPILLRWPDLGIGAVLLLVDGGLSIWLKLRLHGQLAWAAGRMVVQLVAVGLILRAVFSLASPFVTLCVVLVMLLIAAREVAARPEKRLLRFGNLAVGASAVAFATFLTVILALTTAIRPTPWYDPRYAIPLAGIILGNVLNSASLGLDGLLGSVVRERVAIEAQLAMGTSVLGCHARADPGGGPACPAADDQPDGRGGGGDAAWHHDRPDHRRNGSAAGGQIPDIADVPAGWRQWPGGCGRGVFGRHAIDRRPPAAPARPDRRYPMSADMFDLAVIGGGVNGAGIARDAAGRGLSVLLVEQDDLACGTSSASTKLIHGGLRYLERYEFRLVREALAEREVLLRSAPHIIRPLRFVLPHHAGLRPWWELRLGLFLYDHLGGRRILPGTRSSICGAIRWGNLCNPGTRGRSNIPIVRWMMRGWWCCARVTRPRAVPTFARERDARQRGGSMDRGG